MGNAPMTPEAQKIIDELQKESDELRERYQVSMVLTQDILDASNERIRERSKVGDIIKTGPPLSSDPIKALQTLADYYAMQQCIVHKQNYIRQYGDWKMMDLDRVLDELRFFRRNAQLAYSHPESTVESTLDMDYFYKITTDYYNSHAILEHEKGDLARIYGRYILYFNFLEQKSRELYTAGQFSKLDQMGQLDKILEILCNNGEYSVGLNRVDIGQLLKNKNYIISSPLLDEILHKLHKDGHISMYNSTAYAGGQKIENVTYYTVSFEGRYFYRQEGGYKNRIAKQNAENTRLENLESHEKNHRRYITWLTLILSCGTLFQCVYYLADLKSKNVADYAIEGWTFFCVFVLGLGGGAIIYKLTKRQKE